MGQRQRPRLDFLNLTMKRHTHFFATLLLTLSAFSAVSAHANDRVAANKKLVLEFYEAAINKRDADTALKFLGDRYIQHNPLAPDGAAGVKGLIEMLRTKVPQGRNEVKRVIAEGDFVVLHVHAKAHPEDRGRAIIDIFRVENGRIVEHWDVIQPVPETAANNNTMF